MGRCAQQYKCEINNNLKFFSPNLWYLLAYTVTYLGRRISLLIEDILVLQTYVAHSVAKIHTTTDKQPVNKAIVEKLHLKLDFWLLEQFPMFICKSVQIITSFNNSHAGKYEKGIPRLREYVNY